MSRWKPTRQGVGVFAIVTGQVTVTVTTQDLLAQVFHVRFEEEVGVIMPSYMVACTLSVIFFGRLTDKVGPKKMVAGVLPMLVFVLALYGIASSLQAIVLVRVAQGILFGALGSNVILLTRSLVGQDRLTQSKLGAKFKAGTYMGVSLASPIGLWLGHTNVWSAVVVALAIFSCVLIYMGVSLLQGSWWRLLNVTRVDWRSFLEPRALKVSFPGMGVIAAYTAVFTWYADFVGNTTWMAKVILFLIPWVIGASLFTWLPTTFVRIGYFPTMAGSNLLMIISLLLIAFGGSWPSQIVVGIIVGIATAGNSHAMTEETLHRVGKEKSGAATSTTVFIMQLSGMTAVALTSTIWIRLGATAMWLLMIPVLLICLIYLLFNQKRGSSEGEAASEVRVPKMLAHYRSGLASSLAYGGDDEVCFNFLAEKGIDLDTLPLYSPELENKSHLISNVLQALEYLVWAGLQESRLPVAGPIFRLQELLLQLMLELAPDQEYPDRGTKKKKVSALHEEKLEEIRKHSLWLQEDGFKRIEQINEYYDGALHVAEFDYSRTLNLLRAAKVLGVADISGLLKAYEKFTPLLIAA